jgi:hypothetical protein
MLGRLLLACCAGIGACCPAGVTAAGPAMDYLGQWRIPYDDVFDGTVVGGLSGISYDP